MLSIIGAKQYNNHFVVIVRLTLFMILLVVLPQVSSGADVTRQLLLSETWENNSVSNWTYDYIAGDTKIETSPVHSGSYAIKMQSSAPGNYVHFFGDHPQLAQSGSMVTDVTLEEYFYLSSGFMWPTTGLKLWIMNCFESWSANYSLAAGSGKPHTWAPYYMTIGVLPNGAPYGEMTRADGLGGTGALWEAHRQNVGSEVTLVSGKWNKLKFRLKLNDLGRSNGIFKLWINDELKCDYSNMNFRGTYATYGWNHLIMSMHFNPSAPQLEWISRDDIRLISGEWLSAPTGVTIKIIQ